MNDTTRKVFNILSYIGPLFLVGMIANREDASVKFHAKQGMVLFIVEVAGALLSAILGFLLGWLPLIGGILSWVVRTLIGIACLTLMVVGIVNAANDEIKPLPIIGSFGTF